MYIGELSINVELYDTVELSTHARIPIVMNGTKCILMREGGIIVGQMEAKLSFEGTPINVTSKSDRDYQRLVNGELNGKQISITGQVIYNNDNAYVNTRLDARAGSKANYTFLYQSGESFSAKFTPSNPTDRAIMGDKVTSELTLLSSAVIARVLPQ